MLWIISTSLVCSVLLQQNVVSGREARIAGLSLNEWCYSDPAFGFDCTIPGSKCLPAASGTESVCRCDTTGAVKYEQYPGTSPTTGSDQRCAAVKGNLMNSYECELETDCNTKLLNTRCKIDRNTGTRGRCACIAGYIDDTVNGGCKVEDCSTDPAVCNSLAGSICNIATKKCVCPTPRILLNNKCEDPNTYDCMANNKVCPTLPSGKGMVECDTNSRKCICKTPVGSIGSLIFPNGIADCRGPQLGSVCKTSLECPPNNFECKLGSTGTSGLCVCKAYYKANLLDPTLTKCDLAVGTCCKSNSQCGTAPVGSRLICRLSGSATSLTGTCVCEPSLAGIMQGWDDSTLRCR